MEGIGVRFLGCMIGAVSGDTVIVQRIAPADVNPGESTAMSAVEQQQQLRASRP